VRKQTIVKRFLHLFCVALSTFRNLTRHSSGRPAGAAEFRRYVNTYFFGWLHGKIQKLRPKKSR